MSRGLRGKLSASYIFVALICVILISILANKFLEKQFVNYVIQEHERKNKEIVSAITQQQYSDGKWNLDVIESIGVDALENGLIISVKDISGKIVWDANVYNNGKCEAVISHMSRNMMTRYPNWSGKYIKNEYALENNSKKIGVVDIGYYGPYYYNDNDLAYLNTLNKILISVGIISLCFALLIGILMSERISRPILKVIDTAEMIAKGDYSQRLNKKSDIKEINTLMTTINNLGQSLEEQEKLRKRLTRDISHELRTPLTTLQSHMEALIDGVWELTPERIKSFHEETMRLNRLIGDLEKLSTYENKNIVLNKSIFNISEIISNIILNFEKDYMDKNIAITFNPKEVFIFADKDKISQVVINLMSNALKYSLNGGRVKIEVKEENASVVIYFNDTGIGISDEDIPYIFERFYRADKSRNRSTGGAGIGLTITKSIIEAHKGKISVQSKLNEGTEFMIILPKINN